MKTRTRAALTALLALTATVVACGGDGGDGAGSSEVRPQRLEATVGGETVGVTAVDDTYVAPVDDEVYVAVSFDHEDPAEARQAVAYLCDDESGTWVSGPVEQGEAVLEGDGATVEVAVADGTLEGTASVDAADGVAFTADRAAGAAGLYVAEDDDGLTGGWIVLDDGTQRGWWSASMEEEEPLQM